MLAGNHDHGLVAGWIDARLETEPAGFLGLEQRFEPAEAGPLAAALAEPRARRRACAFAYPGIWLRDDVYAIHGHYADVHATVPTFERLAAGAMARWVVRAARGRRAPDDYEAVLAPALRLDARAHAARRPRGPVRRRAAPRRAPGSRSPARAAAGARCAPRRSAPATAPRSPRSTPPASARWSAACRAPRCAAATCTASARSIARLGIGARARDLGPLAPLRPVAGRRPGGVDDAQRRADPQHRLVGLPAALPRPSARTARPTGRAPRSCVDDGAPPRLVRLLGERGHGELGHARA